MVERPPPPADKEKNNQTENHRRIDARLMCRLPKTAFEQHRYLRRCDRDEDLDKKRDCCKSREQTEEDECAKQYFDDPDKGGHDLGLRDADLYEAPDAQSIDEEKFLNSFREEDTPD